jgi:4-amino-4-deoxy-L-arabinose transferase-like glycosyltransferase
VATASRWTGALWREHRSLLLVLTLGIGVRAAIVWETADLDLKIVDEQHYQEIATHLSRGDGFAFEAGATSIRPPLYPLFVAAIWTAIGRDSLVAVRVAQAALGLLTVTLLYAVARQLFGRRTAVLAAAGLCFYPSFLFFTVLLLTEVLFTFLLMLTVTAYVVLLRRPTPPLAFGAGLALGLAALTRSALWPFAAVLAPLVFIAIKGSALRRGAFAALLLAGYGAVIAPWAIRNTHLQGSFTLIDTMGGLNLHMGNYEHTPPDRMWDAVALEGEQHWAAALRREHPDAATWTERQKERWAQSRAIAYMRAHPLQTLKRSIVKFANFWGLERELLGGLRQGLYSMPTWMAFAAIALIGASYVGVVLLASVGVYRAPPGNLYAHAGLLLLVVALSGVHAIVFGHSRYHLPLVPILLLYAAAAVVRIAPHGSFRAAGGPLLTMIIVTGIWMREVLFVDREHLVQLLGALR